MKIFYTDILPIPLPENHRFPKEKYFLLRQRISDQLGDQPIDLRIPKPASKEAILRAHDPEYIQRLFEGGLTEKEIRRAGLPWSPQIVRRARYSVGGTIAACKAAVTDGISVNLGGGTHHAFRDHGQGFCLLNDTVIAARAMQAKRTVNTVLIIDCDVHQGNGTADMVKTDPTIFTFSIHGRNNFPYRKKPSDLDIELADGTKDSAYLMALEKGLGAIAPTFTPDMAIYIAGADPYKKDRLGRLALSKAGLSQRDRLVFKHLADAALPVAVTLGGGYAPNIHDIVEIHFETIRSALEISKLASKAYLQNV